MMKTRWDTNRQSHISLNSETSNLKLSIKTNQVTGLSNKKRLYYSHEISNTMLLNNIYSPFPSTNNHRGPNHSGHMN